MWKTCRTSPHGTRGGSSSGCGKGCGTLGIGRTRAFSTHIGTACHSIGLGCLSSACEAANDSIGQRQRGATQFAMPLETCPKSQADSGGSVGYPGNPMTVLQQRLRRGVPTDQRSLVHDHMTRAVRPDDAEAFALMRPGQIYTDLPAHLGATGATSSAISTSNSSGMNSVGRLRRTSQRTATGTFIHRRIGRCPYARPRGCRPFLTGTASRVSERSVPSDGKRGSTPARRSSRAFTACGAQDAPG